MSSRSHRVRWVGAGCYELSWTVDRSIKGRVWLHPIRYSRETDYAGATRFAKRWGVSMPPTTNTPGHAPGKE